jgi:hypothetical protein
MLGLLTVPGISLAEQPVNENFQPMGLNNAGVYALRQLDPNLTGQGVKFAVICRSYTYFEGEPQNDYRPAASHSCFKDALFTFHDLPGAPGPAGISPHSTAVCSLLFGRDLNAYNEQVGDFSYQGVVPDAKADVYEFWSFLINNIFPCAIPDVNVLTAEIGYQFEDWWTRGIEAMAQQSGLTVVVGIGNGYNASDPVLYPAAGYNVIGVGVVKSLNTTDTATGLSRFGLVYPEYSSRGPTSDGRSKPDIVAPGNCLAAVAGESDPYEPTGDWSSFATPVVAGTAGLLIQKAAENPALSLANARDGGNCVIKALLLNSATKLPYWHKGLLTKDDDHEVPLDWLQGAGMVNALEANRQLSAGRFTPGDCPATGWDLGSLGPDTPANAYKVKITTPADKMITATVVWNRHFADRFPFERQSENDADIQLEIWAFDSNDSNNGYLLDYSDSRNDNVEHIYCPADTDFTDYAIVVSYSNRDAAQPPDGTSYGLCWNVSQQPVRDDSLWLDLNADGSVNDLDITALLDNILASIESPDHYLFGDIDSDGVLDVNDLNIFFRHVRAGAENHPQPE